MVGLSKWSMGVVVCSNYSLRKYHKFESYHSCNVCVKYIIASFNKKKIFIKKLKN